MRNGPSKPVELPHYNRIKSATVGVGYQSVKFRTLLLCARDADIDILARNWPTSTPTVLSQFPQLHFR
jgi:hypothetical protein